jgi:hypothetical protein
MKTFLFFLLWALLPAAGIAQEIDLLPCQNANGKNFRVGVAAQGATLNGIVSRDEQNDFAYLPISGDLSFQNFPAALQEVFYALAPPDSNGNVTAWVIISNPVAPDTFDLPTAMNDAVPDALNQNGWTGASVSVQTVSAGLQVPAGTQFWVYSSTGSLTLAGDPAIFLTDATSVDQVIAAATQPVTIDPSLFLPPDDSDSQPDSTQTSDGSDTGSGTTTDPGTAGTASGSGTTGSGTGTDPSSGTTGSGTGTDPSTGTGGNSSDPSSGTTTTQ